MRCSTAGCGNDARVTLSIMDGWGEMYDFCSSGCLRGFVQTRRGDRNG